MRVLQLTGVKKLSITEIETPKPDGENVIIKVSLAGICGTDIHNWELESSIGMIMGHEFVGTVYDPGSRTDLAMGDRVVGIPLNPCRACDPCKRNLPQLCMQTITFSPGCAVDAQGAYAEYIVIRPDLVRKIPDILTDEEATLIEPAAVALRAVRHSGIKIGDKVLIAGAGIIGVLCALFARRAGASYIAITETNSARREQALKFGYVDDVFDAKDDLLLGNLFEVSEPGFDVFLDCAGAAEAINTGIFALKSGGGIVGLVALSYEPVPLFLTAMAMKEPIIKPMLAYNEEFDLCLDMFSKKLFEVKQFINRTVAMEEVQAVFVDLASGKSLNLKVLVNPNME